LQTSSDIQPIIEIRNLSKRYTLGERSPMYGNLREVLGGMLKLPARLRSLPSKHTRVTGNREFWALKDLSLDIYPGDTVGIIGSNGAGKSTLLKILSKITDPTSGTIKVRGRVGSLLEVGTGFHPELTGRENVYLNGAILGMRRSEIDTQFDEIVSFAGIGNFLDTPVKHYSSGMYVRLAFSIAAHVDPEILVVDEVLAVGDIAFQKKCLGKMAEACARAKTILFVSHNLAAVESLCNRGIVVVKGEMVFAGTSKEAVQYYMNEVETASLARTQHILDLENAEGRPGKYSPSLTRLELYDSEGNPIQGVAPAGAGLRAVIAFRLPSASSSFDASIAFDTPSGQRVCTAHSAYEPGRTHTRCSGEQVFVCEIDSLPLIPGEYRVGVGLDIGGQEVDWVADATQLTIARTNYYATGVVPTRGLFLLENHWTLVPAGEAVGVEQ
jgi:lipopolysaccharide transport system ATP-binding protein